MSAIDEALLEAARLGADDDVLVLGGAGLALGAQRIGHGWIYVVLREVDEIEALRREAHTAGAAGLAYLVGEPTVLPLPDGAVGAAVGRVPTDGDEIEAAAELARVVAAGGRVALVSADDAIAAALEIAGFGDVALAAVGDEVLVTGTRK